MNDDVDRVEQLEARVAALEATVAELTTQPFPNDGPVDSRLPPPPTGLPIEATATGAAPAAPPGQFELDTEGILKWGGVGLVVLAVGFGVSTAVQRGWIGPTLQLIGAVGLGLALIAGGVRLAPTRRPWTHALCSGGVATLLVTFASDLFLDEVSADGAYVLTVMVGLGAVMLARFVGSEWVGVTALVGGSIGWLVIADGDPPFIETGAVFVVVIVTTLAVSIEREWFGLRLVGLGEGIFGVLTLVAESDTGTEQAAALFAAVVVAAALLSVPSIGEMRTPWRPIELEVPSVLAPWAFIVVASMFVDTQRAAGLVAMGSAGVVAMFAVYFRRSYLDGHFVALLVGASVSLTIGLGLLLSTEVAWVAIAIQGAGLVVLRRFVPASWLLALNAGALLAASTIWVVTDGEAAWIDDAAIGTDIARLAVVAAIAVGVWFSNQPEVRQFGGVGVLALFLLWLGSVLVHVPQGQAAVSLSWAVVGVAVLAGGAVRKIPGLGQVGLAVLAVTVAKLLLVDMVEVDALWRAGLFLAVGLAILRLGFVLPRWTEVAADPTTS